MARFWQAFQNCSSTRQSVGECRKSSVLAGAASGDEPGENTSFDFEFESLGKLKTLRSSEIETSPLSLGFEVLDRERFDPTKTYQHLANCGVKWARCQTGWNRCERVKGEFTFDWLDDMSVGWAPVFDDGARDAWLRFVDKLAEHFADRVKHFSGERRSTLISTNRKRSARISVD